TFSLACASLASFPACKCKQKRRIVLGMFHSRNVVNPLHFRAVAVRSEARGPSRHSADFRERRMGRLRARRFDRRSGWAKLDASNDDARARGADREDQRWLHLESAVPRSANSSQAVPAANLRPCVTAWRSTGAVFSRAAFPRLVLALPPKR